MTIPKDTRDQFGNIVLKKAPKKLTLAKWKGRCKDTFAKFGYSSVDKFIDHVRGR